MKNRISATLALVILLGLLLTICTNVENEVLQFFSGILAVIIITVIIIGWNIIPSPTYGFGRYSNSPLSKKREKGYTFFIDKEESIILIHSIFKKGKDINRVKGVIYKRKEETLCRAPFEHPISILSEITRLTEEDEAILLDTTIGENRKNKNLTEVLKIIGEDEINEDELGKDKHFALE